MPKNTLSASELYIELVVPVEKKKIASHPRKDGGLNKVNMNAVQINSQNG